jgi:hypothetical protein
MIRLIIAMVIGALVAVAAVISVQHLVLPTVSNGTPTQASLYQYGNR